MPVRRLLSWIALFAMLLAPVGMTGASAAHGAPAASAHCADRDEPAEPPSPAAIDCMNACAGLPAKAVGLADAAAEPAAAEPVVPAALTLGSGPEAATPPPRLS